MENDQHLQRVNHPCYLRVLSGAMNHSLEDSDLLFCLLKDPIIGFQFYMNNTGWNAFFVLLESKNKCPSPYPTSTHTFVWQKQVTKLIHIIRVWVPKQIWALILPHGPVHKTQHTFVGPPEKAIRGDPRENTSARRSLAINQRGISLHSRAGGICICNCLFW